MDGEPSSSGREGDLSSGVAVSSTSSVLQYLRESRVKGGEVESIGSVGFREKGAVGMDMDARKNDDNSFEENLFNIPGGEGMGAAGLPGGLKRSEGTDSKVPGRKSRGSKSPKQPAEEEEAGKRRLENAVAASHYCTIFFTVVPVAFVALDRQFYARTHRWLKGSYHLDMVVPALVVVAAAGFITWATRRLMACRSRDKLSMGHLTRTHGLMYPWHAWQLLSLFVFWPVLFTVQVVLLPLLEGAQPSLVAYVSCLHYSLVAAVVVLWFVLGYTDPAAVPIPQDEIGPNDTYCQYCNEWYSATERKHCHSCHKCIAGFDHHCNYLNCCVSRKNYAPFYGLVLSIMAMGVLYFFVSLYILTMIFVSPVVAAHSSEVVGWEVSVLLLLALVATSFFTVFLFGNLCLFHTLLTRKGMTTYEYWDNEYDDTIAHRREWQMALYDTDLSLGIMRMWTTHSVRMAFNGWVLNMDDEMDEKESGADTPVSKTTKPESPKLWWGDSATPTSRESPVLAGESNSAVVPEMVETLAKDYKLRHWGSLHEMWRSDSETDDDDNDPDEDSTVAAIMHTWESDGTYGYNASDIPTSPSPAASALCCGQKASEYKQSRVMRVALGFAAGTSEVTRSKTHSKRNNAGLVRARSLGSSRSVELTSRVRAHHRRSGERSPKTDIITARTEEKKRRRRRKKEKKKKAAEGEDCTAASDGSPIHTPVSSSGEFSADFSSPKLNIGSLSSPDEPGDESFEYGNVLPGQEEAASELRRRSLITATPKVGKGGLRDGGRAKNDMPSGFHVGSCPY